jgi:beta-galactosidase/beta-glucuronidase
MLPISKLPQMCLALAIAAGGWSRAADEPKTERQYLSGHGPKDAVPWNFECTGGRRAGEKTTIPVPSNWEQHGFGNYNYGSEDTKSDEHGLYQTHFTIPESWTGRRIRLVFNGVMTEASVKVNGKRAPDQLMWGRSTNFATTSPRC